MRVIYATWDWRQCCAWSIQRSPEQGVTFFELGPLYVVTGERL